MATQKLQLSCDVGQGRLKVTAIST